MSGQSHRRQTSAQERAEGFFSWIFASGLEIAGVHRLLFLWKRVGIGRTLIIIAVVGMPASEYSLLSIAANRTVPRLAGDFGVDFDADWSYHPFSLLAIARNVRIKPAHPSTAPPILTASEIDFQGNLSTAIASLWDAVHFRPLQTFNEITVHHGVLQIDRSIDGDLNLADGWGRIDERRRRDLMSGAYHVEAINFDDSRIEYVEHLHGGSGSGIIQSANATIYLDGIAGSIVDLRPVVATDVTTDGRIAMPTRVAISGRLADGTIDLRGDVALTSTPALRPPLVPAGPDDPRLVAVSSVGSSGVLREVRSGPYYALTLRLDNIGAAAFTHAVPNLQVVATHGVIHGKITLKDDLPTCTADAAMVDVRFGPNPAVVAVPARLERLRTIYERWVYSGAYNPCQSVVAGPGAPDPEAAPPSATGAAGLVLAFNRQATATAPPAVRAVVANDTERVTGMRLADAAIGDAVDRVADELGDGATRLLGNRAGTAVQETLRGRPTSAAAQTDSTSNDTALAKGAKGIGRGFKKLFRVK